MVPSYEGVMKLDKNTIKVGMRFKLAWSDDRVYVVSEIYTHCIGCRCGTVVMNCEFDSTEVQP
jgi:hypothetical protein